MKTSSWTPLCNIFPFLLSPITFLNHNSSLFPTMQAKEDEDLLVCSICCFHFVLLSVHHILQGSLFLGLQDEEDEEMLVDSEGNRAKTARQLAQEEAQRRANRGGPVSAALQKVVRARAAALMEVENNVSCSIRGCCAMQGR